MLGEAIDLFSSSRETVRPRFRFIDPRNHRGHPKPVRCSEAKDLFLATLPIGSGILAYWFAARGRSSSGDNDK